MIHFGMILNTEVFNAFYRYLFTERITVSNSELNGIFSSNLKRYFTSNNFFEKFCLFETCQICHVLD